MTSDASGAVPCCENYLNGREMLGHVFFKGGDKGQGCSDMRSKSVKCWVFGSVFGGLKKSTGSR